MNNPHTVIDYFRHETVESGVFTTRETEGDSVVSFGQEPSITSFTNEEFETARDSDGDDEEDGDGDGGEEDGDDREGEEKIKNEVKDIIPSSQLYLGRLKRRALLISEMRKAYLRDIVLLKHILHEYLTQEDRESILIQWEKSIPSLDLRQHFMIYSPHESSLDVIPCETCGGSVEIVHHDSSEIQELSKALSHLDKNKNELRVMIAKKNLQIENLELKFETEERKHKEEKRFLYAQMKELRANDELLRAENAELQERNQDLKAENHEFKVLNKNQLQMKEQLTQAGIEINRMKAEFRQLEEVNENAKEQIRFLTEKLQIQTMRADANAKQIATYKSETEESKAAALKYKTTVDSLQKKSIRIETLLEEARREVEDLRTTKSNLLLDLETLQNQSSAEIEMLEASRDQLRVELDTCNDILADVRATLTSTLMERENLESNYEALMTTYNNYKADTDEELRNLRKLPHKVSDLEKKLNKAELDLDGYRLNEAPVDKEAVEKVKSQMRRLTQQTHVTVPPPVFPSHTSSNTSTAEHTPVNTPSKTRSDGRRIGVIVKDAREGKSSPAKIDPVSGAIGLKTPISAKPTLLKEKTAPIVFSPKGATDDKIEENGIVEHEIVVNDVEPLENLDLSVESTQPAPRKKSMRSIQTTRKSSIGNKEMKQKSTSAKEEMIAPIRGKSIKSNDRGSTTVTQQSKSTNERPAEKIREGKLLENVLDSEKSITLVNKSDEVSSLHNQSLDEVKSLVGNEEATNSSSVVNDDEVEGEDDTIPEMLFPPRVLLKNSSMSQRRMTRLASLEDPVLPSSDEMLNKVVETLVTDEESASEAGIDDNLKFGLLRSLSQMSSYSRAESSEQVISSRSFIENPDGESNDAVDIAEEEEEEEEVDEIEEEMSNDVAKTWGQLTKALNNALSENLGDEIANKASHVIAPVTIEFCSILSKCTMGMWRMTKVAKKTADLFCKLKLIYDYINPQFGAKPDTTELETAQELMKNPVRFQKRSEAWMNDYNFNRDLLSSLCRMDYDESLGKLVDSKASSYFGYDPTMRQVKFEVALNTVLQLKDYNDFMIDDIDICLKRLFIDWAESKLNSAGGLGKYGELKLSLLNEELGVALSRKDALEKENADLMSELEMSKKRIVDMLPDNKRAKELSDRNSFLNSTLQETQMQLEQLILDHKSLVELKNQYETQSIIQAATIESMVKDTNEKQKLIIELDKDLTKTINEKIDKSNQLATMVEMERARLNDLITVTVQTEPLVSDASVQTDFIVPPMSLRHRVSNEVSRNSGASSKVAYFPVVTPSIGPPATLKDCYPENEDLSLPFEELDMFGNTSSILSSRTDLEGIRSRPGTSQKKPLPQHHDVGLPSVWSEYSINRPASASVSLFQGTYERPSPHNSLSFGNDWEHMTRPKTSDSQNHLRDKGLHNSQSKSRPSSSIKSIPRPTTAQSAQDILITHQINQYHKSRKFLSSR